MGSTKSSNIQKSKSTKKKKVLSYVFTNAIRLRDLKGPIKLPIENKITFIALLLTVSGGFWKLSLWVLVANSMFNGLSGSVNHMLKLYQNHAYFN
jgi:hypothetical protein